MAKPTILPAWDTTEVNSVEPDQDHKDEGWLAPGGVPEKPKFQTFNFWQNNVYKWINALNISGVLLWDSTTIYVITSYVVGSNGKLYKSKVGSNQGNDPTSSPANWEEAIVPVVNATETARGVIELATSTEVIAGTDIERAITPAGLQAKTSLTTRKGIVELATDAETQAGVDNARAITPATLASFAKSITKDGYIKLAGGLIIQWGEILSVATTGKYANFPIPFPTACLVAVGGRIANANKLHSAYVGMYDATQIRMFDSHGSPSTCNYVAIGH